MKRILSLILTAVMLFSFASCSSADSSETQPDTALTTTETAATKPQSKPLDNYKAFSGVVLMTKNGKTVFEKAEGVQNNDTGKPIKIDTLFCVGSVAKQFTAAAVLTLQQDGKLSVEDKLSKYYPDYEYGDDLSLWHLLSMRSGIREFYDIEYIDGAFTELPAGELRETVTNDNSVRENREALEEWLLEQPLEFEPDTEFEYSNSNYFLLARIVEKVSGKNYYDYLREKIINPLGMKHTFFIDEVDFKDVPNLAAPTVNPETVYVGVTMGLGDMISNAYDIDKWLTSFRTNKILTKESLQLMTTDYTDEDEDHYGFGIRIIGGGLFHTGAITTYETMAYTDIKNGINVFAVTNDDPDETYSVVDMVWELLDKKGYGVT